jgi:hypothetical protein
MFNINVTTTDDRKSGVTLVQNGNMGSSNKKSSTSDKDTSAARAAYDELMKNGKKNG